MQTDHHCPGLKLIDFILRSHLFEAINDGYVWQCGPWLLEHNDGIQYGGVWQFFVKTDSANVLADYFADYF